MSSILWGVVTRTRNVSEYMLVLALCLVVVVAILELAVIYIVCVSVCLSAGLGRQFERLFRSAGWGMMKTVIVSVLFLLD